MKKLTLFIPIALGIMLFITGCAEKQTVYSWTENLRIRSTPDLEGDVIGKLAKNEAVEFMDETGSSFSTEIDGNLINGSWIKIKTLKGVEGWAFSGGLDCLPAGQFKWEEPESKGGNNEEKGLLYVPAKKTVSSYDVPHPGTEKAAEIKGPIEIKIIAEYTIEQPCFGTKKNWIIGSYYKDGFNKQYLLVDNLITIDSLMNTLDRDFSCVAGFFNNFEESFIEYKSVKTYENGDDGAVWGEESELNFNFADSLISMGYMYTRSGYNMLGIYKEGTEYVFVCDDGGYRIISLRMKFNNDGSINFLSGGDLSGKYVPGKAANF